MLERDKEKEVARDKTNHLEKLSVFFVCVCFTVVAFRCKVVDVLRWINIIVLHFV